MSTKSQEKQRMVQVIASLAAMLAVGNQFDHVAGAAEPPNGGIDIVVAGDANCDGVVNADDIAPFAMALTDENEYAANYPGCDRIGVTDVNADGAADLADIDAFMVILGDQGINERLEIGPIEGLTLDWHAAPALTAMPQGSVVSFRFPVRSGSTTDKATWGEGEIVSLQWRGAEQSADQAHATTAFNNSGLHVVELWDVGNEEADVLLGRSLFVVVDVPSADIRFEVLDVFVNPFDLGNDATNEETMEFFFGESIAALRQVGPRHYVTSIHRLVGLEVRSLPGGFGALAELRLDDVPITMGAAAMANALTTGRHRLASGSPTHREGIRLDTYATTITLQAPHEYPIPDGEPVTFTAVTNPPGYEDEIRWLSSTKYGSAMPVVGDGATFTAQFDNTWGVDDNGNPFQWIGVRADEDIFNQDQKVGACLLADGCANVVSEEECNALAGLFQGQGTMCPTCEDCEQEICDPAEFGSQDDQQLDVCAVAQSGRCCFFVDAEGCNAVVTCEGTCSCSSTGATCAFGFGFDAKCECACD